MDARLARDRDSTVCIISRRLRSDICPPGSAWGVEQRSEIPRHLHQIAKPVDASAFNSLGSIAPPSRVQIAQRA